MTHDRVHARDNRKTTQPAALREDRELDDERTPERWAAVFEFVRREPDPPQQHSFFTGWNTELQDDTEAESEHPSSDSAESPSESSN